jgi:hypothetical protein
MWYKNYLIQELHNTYQVVMMNQDTGLSIIAFSVGIKVLPGILLSLKFTSGVLGL